MAPAASSGRRHRCLPGDGSEAHRGGIDPDSQEAWRPGAVREGLGTSGDTKAMQSQGAKGGQRRMP